MTNKRQSMLELDLASKTLQEGKETIDAIVARGIDVDEDSWPYVLECSTALAQLAMRTRDLADMLEESLPALKTEEG